MRNKAKSAALLSCFVAIWSAGASAQNANDPRRKLDPVLNNNAVRINPNPGPVNRVTPNGVRPMTPNATSQIGRLRARPVPAPTSPNARYNTQGRNINPTGDPKIAGGFDKNQKRHNATTQKPVTASPTRTTASTVSRPSWPGPARPAGTSRPTTSSTSSTSSSSATTTKK